MPADHRIGDRKVVEYETEDGRRHLCPPRDGRAYRVVVHDVDAYQRWCRSGFAYGREHTGRTGQVVDNRNAPGS